MRQLDLQTPLGSCRSLTEYFEDQARPVDDLTLEFLLEISLLDRAERTVHHHKFRLLLFARDANVFDLSGAEEKVRPDFANLQNEAIGYDNANRQREAFRLRQARLGIEVVSNPADIRADDEGPRSARNLAQQIVIETQLSSSSQSSVRSTGVVG